jgi:phospholipid/cholesterol/gamma-HCH transport system substrate-binding protein
VLADQHEELVDMLGALDRLGVVGTRVIRASKDDLLRSLSDLRPVLDKLGDVGPKLAAGLNLLASFPFPQEASEVVLGDYANTSMRLDINFDNLFKGLGIPAIDLSGLLGNNPIGPLLDKVTRCLRSGGLTTRACRDVLANGNLLRQLVDTCKRDGYRNNLVCRALGGGGGLGGLLDGLSGGLGGLLGLNRFNAALTNGVSSPAATGDSLFGGGS